MDLERAAKRAFDALERAQGDIFALSKERQIFVAVYTGQAIIDNGGLSYFFENNFQDTPPYSFFVNAYAAIGSADVAEAIRKATELFQFPQSHLHEAERRKVLSSAPDLLAQLEPIVSPNPTVWRNLAAYAQHHASALGGA